MANLPEKNVVLVDKITNVPTDSNLFINANGEFKQASVNDVVNSSTVVSTAVETAINTAVQDSIDSNFKQTSGSPILLTDSADGTLIDFKGKGRSTQNGTPTPDNPIAIESVADSGWFDGELLQGDYSLSTGVFQSKNGYVCGKNSIPCKEGDVVNIILDSSMYIYIYYYNENIYVSNEYKTNVTQAEFIIPNGITSFKFCIGSGSTNLTNAPHITVTINGKYALIVKSNGKNLWEYGELSFTLSSGVLYKRLKAGTYTISALVTSSGTDATTSVIYFGNAKGDIKGVSLQRGTRNSVTFTLDEDITKMTFYAETNYSNSNKDTATWSDIQIEYGDKVTEYEPRKEKISYITLSAPLRSSLDGTVTDEVSLTEVTRRFKEVVFDGSDDEGWNVISTNTNTNLFRIYPPTKAKVSPIICSHFVYYSGSNEDFEHTRLSAEANPVLAMWVNKTRIATVDEWKAYLQANPIRVIYELAEPITETIEPVDIVTYDNVTYLTASDDADMEIEYPTTKVAGIASIGYSKGIKAEYETEQLKKQLLEIQATIVNTL